MTGQLSKFMVAGGSSREISTAFVVHEFNIIKDIKITILKVIATFLNRDFFLNESLYRYR